ncbi:hypothetical protein [Marinoscillum sp.]|uniref:hypothetical protein n=1 Tax=Marinoscillum sp. TaxID=2024838 RepID=UPI003BAB6288
MTLQLSIRKQTLRLLLGIITLIIPIVIALAILFISNEEIQFTSMDSYLYTGLRYLVVCLLLITCLILVMYGLTFYNERLTLFVSAGLLLLMVFVPVSLIDTYTWADYIPQLTFVLFLASLGWHVRYTFNLPLGFPALTKIGLGIWMLTFVLLVWVLTLQSFWPPMTFILETLILWQFTAGIFIRHQINKKLGG